MKTTSFTLENTAQILIRCFWIGLALQTLCFVFALGAGEWAYEIHKQLFDISKQQFDLILYWWIALVKIILLFGFLLPYIAIRMVISRQSAETSKANA